MNLTLTRRLWMGFALMALLTLTSTLVGWDNLRFISQVEKDWNSAEHLIGVMPQYRYSLVLNYNTEERTPGKGSAIFLHGLHTWKTWTEGCIAIPEEYVRLLVQQLGENARIVIMPQIPEAQME